MYVVAVYNAMLGPKISNGEGHSACTKLPVSRREVLLHGVCSCRQYTTTVNKHVGTDRGILAGSSWSGNVAEVCDNVKQDHSDQRLHCKSGKLHAHG